MNILVTGANRGLGLAFVKLGLEYGHHIYACVRNLQSSQTVHLKELQKMYTNHLHIIELDVSSDDSVINAYRQVERYTSYLDSLINNAGVLMGRDQSIEKLDLGDVIESFNVNTLGPVRVTKYFLPLLKKGHNQSIINISSDSASISKPMVKDYPYGLSKVALNLFSEKLKRELKAQNIHVYAIHPGWLLTDMGGEQAPLNPIDSAREIFRIIHRKKEVESPHTFINHYGRPMDL